VATSCRPSLVYAMEGENWMLALVMWLS
jgi:hypothetical protein